MKKLILILIALLISGGTAMAEVADHILWEPGNVMLWETNNAVSWEETASPRNNIELFMLILSQVDGSLGGSYWAQIENREVAS